jgi:hypothetical protein
LSISSATSLRYGRIVTSGRTAHLWHRERTVLEYAEAMTDTLPAVMDEAVEGLRKISSPFLGRASRRERRLAGAGRRHGAGPRSW